MSELMLKSVYDLLDKNEEMTSIRNCINYFTRPPILSIGCSSTEQFVTKTTIFQGQVALMIGSMFMVIVMR